MSYATAADLVKRKDARLLGQLCSDDGTTVPADQLEDDANLLAALDDASGEIEAALLQGQRYTVADLEGLSGNSAAYLARLCCDIAFGYLFDRRPNFVDDPRYEQAMENRRKALDRLRLGEHIFNIDSAKEAGVPYVGGPTRVERRQQNRIASRARGHFYPNEVLPENR